MLSIPKACTRANTWKVASLVVSTCLDSSFLVRFCFTRACPTNSLSGFMLWKTSAIVGYVDSRVAFTSDAHFVLLLLLRSLLRRNIPPMAPSFSRCSSALLMVAMCVASAAALSTTAE
ncbi:GPI-anchored surface protein, putative, partial [Bodo saltans]